MADLTPHAWSKDALLVKSQRFFEEMFQHPRDDWRFAHWSSLALELLARAVLAKVSPVLLADQNSWNNVYYALGHKPKAAKFVPASIGVGNVFNRLREILPNFTTDMESFGIVHMARRNEDLHSGDTPFDSLSATKWLPAFYETCKCLAESLDLDLELLIGAEEAMLAETMISASRDESAKVVSKSVTAHKTVWEGKSVPEKTKLASQASVWATRDAGHRVKCPACACDALVYGVPIAEPRKTIDGDDITETQQYLPSRFECVACGLKISNYAQLSACGLGDPYKSTSTYSAAEYYSNNDMYDEYGDDNNEPF
jgi:hypothetical protein